MFILDHKGQQFFNYRSTLLQLLSIFVCILAFVNLAFAQTLELEETGEAVKKFGENLGLALLDGLLQKSQEEVAKQALKKQIELLEDVNPSYAQLLKQIPPDQLIAAAAAQRQAYSPVQDTGNPFLNVLAKNGIIVGSNVVRQSGQIDKNQQQQVGSILETILTNVLQSVQPSLVQNPLFGAAYLPPTQEITNPLAPNANQLVIPSGGSPSSVFQANAQALLGSLGQQNSLINNKNNKVNNINSLKSLLGNSGGFARGAPSGPGDQEVPPNPFAPSVGVPDPNSITIPPEFLTTAEVQQEQEQEQPQSPEPTFTEEYSSAESTGTSSADYEYETTSINSRLKKLEEINNRAVKLLALRKLRFGINSATSETPAPPKRLIKPKLITGAPKSAVVRPVQISTAVDRNNQQQSFIKPLQRTTLEQINSFQKISKEKEEIADSEKQNILPPPQPPQSFDFNSKNFAFSGVDTDTHQEFRGGTKFGDVKENAQHLELPIQNSPRGGFGRKTSDNTLIGGGLNLPKQWLSGQPLSFNGQLRRTWNNGLFGGGELPNG